MYRSITFHEYLTGHRRYLGHWTVRYLVLLIELLDEDRMCELDRSLSIIMVIKCKLAAHVFRQFPFVLSREGLYRIALDLFNQRWGSKHHDVIDPGNKHDNLTTFPGKIQAWICLRLLVGHILYLFCKHFEKQ